jgi:hypothetical protein
MEGSFQRSKHSFSISTDTADQLDILERVLRCSADITFSDLYTATKRHREVLGLGRFNEVRKVNRVGTWTSIVKSNVQSMLDALYNERSDIQGGNVDREKSDSAVLQVSPSFPHDDGDDDDEYTNLRLCSASCSFYSYIPHFPSPSPSISFLPSFLISLYPYCNYQISNMSLKRVGSSEHTTLDNDDDADLDRPQRKYQVTAPTMVSSPSQPMLVTSRGSHLGTSDEFSNHSTQTHTTTEVRPKTYSSILLPFLLSVASSLYYDSDGGDDGDDEYTNLLQSLLPALSTHILLTFHLPSPSFLLSFTIPLL